MSTAVADIFFSSFGIAEAGVVHCFIPIKKFNEIDTTIIFHHLWKHFPQVMTVVPRADIETGEMESLRYTAETELAENTWNIREPLHDELVMPAEIDIILVPGLAFDRNGHRVGYGKGFYDRFLPKCRPDCIKIGLSYFEPVEAIADVHEMDAVLDHVITPSGAVAFPPQVAF